MTDDSRKKKERVFCMIPWPKNGTSERHSDSNHVQWSMMPAKPSQLLSQKYGFIPLIGRSEENLTILVFLVPFLHVKPHHARAGKRATTAVPQSIVGECLWCTCNLRKMNMKEEQQQQSMPQD
jgi:hypothetical protein